MKIKFATILFFVLCASASLRLMAGPVNTATVARKTFQSKPSAISHQPSAFTNSWGVVTATPPRHPRRELTTSEKLASPNFFIRRQGQQESLNQKP